MPGSWFRPGGRRTRLPLWSNQMIPRVTAAKHVRDFIIHLRFADGTEGDVDLSGELHGEVFEALTDQALFRQFYVHPDFHTLTWPNGADLAPEFLYERVQIPA